MAGKRRTHLFSPARRPRQPLGCRRARRPEQCIVQLNQLHARTHSRDMERLSRSEERYRLLAEHVSDIIWVRDLDMNLLWVSPSIERMAGHSAETEMSRPYTDLLTPASLEKVGAMLAGEIERSASGEADPSRSRTVEVEYVKPDGSTVWCDIAVTFLHDEDGVPDRILGVTRDISRRKLKERELVEEKERYRILAENVSEVIWVLDADMRYDYVSPSVERTLGYTPEEFASRPLSHLVEPSSLERLLALVRYRKQTIAEDPEHEFEDVIEVEYNHANGGTVWLEISARPLRDEEGRLVGLVGSSRNVTDRKTAEAERERIEEQIQKARRMESLSVLAGGIAHDFNNLLTGIIGNASLALSDLPRGSPAIESLVEIEKAAQRASELSSMMLAYSGKSGFTYSDADVDDIAREALVRIRDTVHDGVDLELHPAGGLPAVSADTEQIIDVLQNLVDNAADALDEGRGRIDVSTGIVECKRDELSRMHADPDVLPGRFVFLEVRDSGEGMDEATLSKIFEPFFSTRFTGRGLGLSAVLGIVRGHGGAIDVETRPDDGTRVRVLLPVDGSASRTP